MTHVSDLNPDDVVLAGDWHGALWQARAVMDYAERRDVKVIVQLGDFGVWPGEDGGRFLKGLNNELKARDMLVLFVDGNHEDFDTLYSYPLEPEGHRILRSNIWHLPRGLRWEWHGVKFAALGGAHSVDRDMRTEGRTWWPQEWVTDEELELFKAGGPADIVFMHDSPAGAPNSVVDSVSGQKQAAEWFGQHNLERAAEHRARLQTAIDPVEPAMIFHGHYHQQMSGEYTHSSSKRCLVTGLDEGAAPGARCMQLLPVAEMTLLAEAYYE